MTLNEHVSDSFCSVSSPAASAGDAGHGSASVARAFLPPNPDNCGMDGTGILAECASAWLELLHLHSDTAAGSSHLFRTTKTRCGVFFPTAKWPRTRALPQLKAVCFQHLGLNSPPGTSSYTLWSGAPLQRCPWPSALPVQWGELPVHDFHPLQCYLGDHKKKSSTALCRGEGVL